ncbi:MAG: cysteine-rich CWC family protein [Pyrinomonadaceae bacterium]|nr:cysteine-rich CWC family protein [Pyrinomonadaceae bacterium]
MSLVVNQTTTKNCSKCGAAFGCGITSTNANCWCMDLPNVGPVATSDQDCLCPNCLAEAIAGLSLADNQATEAPTSATYLEGPLVEGEDYYLEGAAMVFTAHFLLRRGYCCESGCRHCPFDSI